MWINGPWFKLFTDKLIDERNELSRQRWVALEQATECCAENTRLKIENAHHLSTIDWFKMRLNAVERERSAWFAYVTGGGPKTQEPIRVAPPQFDEGFAPLHEQMNDQFNPFGEVGEDSLDPADRIPTHVEDVSTMPRSRG